MLSVPRPQLCNCNFAILTIVTLPLKLLVESLHALLNFAEFRWEVRKWSVTLPRREQSLTLQYLTSSACSLGQAYIQPAYTCLGDRETYQEFES